MDENEFFDYIDKKFMELGIKSNKQFYDLKLWFQNNGYMKPIGDTPSSTPKKEGYKISDKGCNRCGGKITWDNYSKEEGGQNYPDHIDEDGNIMPNGCPQFN